MKAKSEIVCKVTKNRFNGRTDTWLMNIDYEHMRFNDMLVQPQANADLEIAGISNGTDNLDDFGIITADKQQKAEQYAKDEIGAIARDDVQAIQQHDKNSGKDPFAGDELDNILSDLGL